MPTGASSFRVLRAGVARTLADLRLGAPYYIATVPMIGARYACIPTVHRRRAGRSRFRPVRLVGHSFELFFGYSWRPLNASDLVAALGAVGAMLLAGLGVAGVVGPTAESAGALLVSAGTLGLLAVVGRYLHRLMVDQKPARPYYVREANVPCGTRIDSTAATTGPTARRRRAARGPCYWCSARVRSRCRFSSRRGDAACEPSR